MGSGASALPILPSVMDSSTAEVLAGPWRWDPQRFKWFKTKDGIITAKDFMVAFRDADASESDSEDSDDAEHARRAAARKEQESMKKLLAITPSKKIVSRTSQELDPDLKQELGLLDGLSYHHQTVFCMLDTRRSLDPLRVFYLIHNVLRLWNEAATKNLADRRQHNSIPASDDEIAARRELERQQRVEMIRKQKIREHRQKLNELIFRIPKKDESSIARWAAMRLQSIYRGRKWRARFPTLVHSATISVSSPLTSADLKRLFVKELDGSYKVLDKAVLNEYIEQGHVKILWGKLWHMDLLIKIGGMTVDPTLLKAASTGTVTQTPDEFVEGRLNDLAMPNTLTFGLRPEDATLLRALEKAHVQRPRRTRKRLRKYYHAIQPLVHALPRVLPKADHDLPFGDTAAAQVFLTCRRDRQGVPPYQTEHAQVFRWLHAALERLTSFKNNEPKFLKPVRGLLSKWCLWKDLRNAEEPLFVALQLKCMQITRDLAKAAETEYQAANDSNSSEQQLQLVEALGREVVAADLRMSTELPTINLNWPKATDWVKDVKVDVSTEANHGRSPAAVSIFRYSKPYVVMQLLFALSINDRFHEALGRALAGVDGTKYDLQPVKPFIEMYGKMEADHKQHIADVKSAVIENRIQMEKKASAKREAEQRRLEKSLETLTEEIKRYDTEEIRRQQAQEEEIRERLRNGLGSTIGNLVTIVMEREAEGEAAREERDAASGEDENAAAASAASGAVEEDDHKSVSHEGDTNLLKYQKLPPLSFLDVIRCVITFDTVQQLAQGYEAIKRQLGSIVKVCNTLDREYDAVQLDDGFRCITLNCVFAPTKSDGKPVTWHDVLCTTNTKTKWAQWERKFLEEQPDLGVGFRPAIYQAKAFVLSDRVRSQRVAIAVQMRLQLCSHATLHARKKILLDILACKRPFNLRTFFDSK